jgi:hypothetical protein
MRFESAEAFIWIEASGSVQIRHGGIPARVMPSRFTSEAIELRAVFGLTLRPTPLLYLPWSGRWEERRVPLCGLL